MAEDPSIGGQHSETPFRLTAVLPLTRLTFTITPPAGYEAMLLHTYTFGGTIPETFQVWVGQRMASYHTVILSEWEIRSGVTIMQGITASSPGQISLQNLDPINPHPFLAALWQVNIPRIQGLDILLAAIKRRYGLVEIIQTAAPAPTVRPPSLVA